MVSKFLSAFLITVLYKEFIRQPFIFYFMGEFGIYLATAYELQCEIDHIDVCRHKDAIYVPILKILHPWLKTHQQFGY